MLVNYVSVVSHQIQIYIYARDEKYFNIEICDQYVYQNAVMIFNSGQSELRDIFGNENLIFSVQTRIGWLIKNLIINISLLIGFRFELNLHSYGWRQLASVLLRPRQSQVVSRKSIKPLLPITKHINDSQLFLSARFGLTRVSCLITFLISRTQSHF